MARHVPKRSPRDATVRVGSVLAVPMVLRSLGADEAKVFAEARIAPAVFDEPDHRIPFSTVGRLLKRCVAATDCHHFGLLVGQRSGLHSIGLVGLLVKYSVDVETALRRLASYIHLHHGAARVSLTVHGGVANVTYEILQPDIEAVEQFVDGALAGVTNALRLLCGADWRAEEVRLSRPLPRDLRPYSQFFRAPLHFNAEPSTITFAAEWLKSRLPDFNQELSDLLQKQIDALEARHPDSFPEQVRTVLRTSLLTGNAGVDQVAALFSMPSRTLRGRLQAAGTSFKLLADGCREELARQMLQNTAMDISQIAAALNYADASAFTRAFRRWTGTTPTVWRADQGIIE